MVMNFNCMDLNSRLPLATLAILAAAFAGCSESESAHDYEFTGDRGPTAPLTYGSYPKLTKDNPYAVNYDNNLIYEGYSAKLARNRSYTGYILSYRTVELDDSHPAHARFTSRVPASPRDSARGLNVYQVEVRLDDSGQIVPVFVENTRYFEVGQRIFVIAHGSPVSGFLEMPDAYKTRWKEGYNRALLPDSEYVALVQSVNRVFVLEDNPAYERLRWDYFGINVGRGRIDCWCVDLRIMTPDGANYFTRTYVPLKQEFKAGEKVIARTHGGSLNGWLEVCGYAEALGRGEENPRHEPNDND